MPFSETSLLRSISHAVLSVLIVGCWLNRFWATEASGIPQLPELFPAVEDAQISCFFPPPFSLSSSLFAHSLALLLPSLPLLCGGDSIPPPLPRPPISFTYTEKSSFIPLTSFSRWSSFSFTLKFLENKWKRNCHCHSSLTHFLPSCHLVLCFCVSR